MYYLLLLRGRSLPIEGKSPKKQRKESEGKPTVTSMNEGTASAAVSERRMKADTICGILFVRPVTIVYRTSSTYEGESFLVIEDPVDFVLHHVRDS